MKSLRFSCLVRLAFFSVLLIASPGAAQTELNESVAVTLSGTRVTIAGTSAIDVISVSANTTNVTIKINGFTTRNFPSKSVDSIYAYLGESDDTFSADGLAIVCSVFGQDGNDTIVGGRRGDVLFGGGGRDIVVGGLGPDEIYGEFGEDFLVGGALSPSDLAIVKTYWLNPLAGFAKRVNAIRPSAIVTANDFAIDHIDGGAEQNPDVFVGSYAAAETMDVRLNFYAMQDLRGLELPNIVLITADDLGFQLGCYGDTIATTPNIDAFAAGGCRFTRGYVAQANCSPSRSAMLTGLYPHQNGQIGNVMPPLPSTGLPAYGMNDGIRTLPTILKENGYNTGIIGKLHVHPSTAFDFQYSATGVEPSRDVRVVLANLRRFNEQRGIRPFFLMLNFIDPHAPMIRDLNGSPAIKVTADQVPNGFPFNWDRSPANLSSVADYYTCVNRLDESFGKVHEFFAQNNLTNNTIFVFVSDNGPAFDRAKTFLFEAGISLPFMIRWPGVTKPNQVIDEFVSTIDLLPTFLAAARVPVPGNLPGRSLRTLLSKGTDAGWRDSYCAEYNSHAIETYAPKRSIRRGQYKLILNLLADPDIFPNGMLGDQVLTQIFKRNVGPYAQLYDLTTDPYETRTVFHPAIQAELMAELQAWRVQTVDPLLDNDFLKAQTQWHIDFSQPLQ